MGLGLACLGAVSALLGFAVNLSWKKKDQARTKGGFEEEATSSENPVYPAV